MNSVVSCSLGKAVSGIRRQAVMLDCPPWLDYVIFQLLQESIASLGAEYR